MPSNSEPPLKNRHLGLRSRTWVLIFVALLIIVVAWALLRGSDNLRAEQVPVRYKEGLSHGLLTLSTLDGRKLADGENWQVAKGNQVTSNLIFYFADGSRYEDTTVFSEDGVFKLLRDHVVQRGPAFKHPKETTVDTSTGRVSVRYEDHGKEKFEEQTMQLPPDVANGLTSLLTKDINPGTPQTVVSYVAFSPKPRLVKLVIVPSGKQTLWNGKEKLEGLHYTVKVHIGGVAGKIAPLIGKQPRDTQVWILGGKAPAFVRLETELDDGPMWRIEMAPPARF